MSRGFTLIEAIIYMALLSLLLAGALLSSYYILIGQSSAHSHNATQEEGGFVTRKLEWALNNVTTITTPSLAAPYNNNLDLVSNSNTHIQIRRNVTNKSVEMSENGSVYLPLTSVNVGTTSLSFHYIAASAGSPEGIEASTTIGGEEFDVIRYLK